ncbi:MAG TPA: sigma 54-interacting transcriptional regulator [candidate division Zixibacteria bacterium]|nr:sigma 54-interacting transcriptional regulator [candidate division Zixibacteria bacterium]
MTDAKHNPLDKLDNTDVLRALVEGTAAETGTAFFKALVENLHRAIGVFGVWVAEYSPGAETMRALAFWLGDRFVEDFVYQIKGTPCADVVKNLDVVHIPERLLDLYPADPDIREAGAVSYMGAPLFDVDGALLGHLAVMDTRPMPQEPRAWALFRIFANRAGAELRRLRAENKVRENEAKLRRLVDSAMDAIIELDATLTVTMVNNACETVLQCPANQAIGKNFLHCLAETSAAKLTQLIAELNARPEGKQYLWIPGGLKVISLDGVTFPAEATISRYEMHGATFYTLILRNINDRIAAENRIHTLTAHTEYLREQLKELQLHGDIIGDSEAMLRTLHDIKQVAGADTTVLITGETGSGKELIARAIHNASARRDKPLITVNCAAIPAALIESEFFGHEKGAFTGATQKREGRFTLADGGTIFLDEIGELPLDLQSKLLRVLQEGEFQPVGGSRTHTVDVRVIAATNRDLKSEIAAGSFREDLYYRLNVFPIDAPPLRERGDDVIHLANSFARRFARKLGRHIDPLSPAQCDRLKAYDWPGNVRELQNVIERAVITAHNGRLNFDRSLPAHESGATPAPGAETRVLTAAELAEMERQNIIKALKQADWRVSGAGGAAEILGVKPTTLSSRIKTLGISRDD